MNIDFEIGNTEEKITKLLNAKAMLTQTLAFLKGSNTSADQFPFIFSIKLANGYFGKAETRDLNLEELGVQLDEQFIVAVLAKIDSAIKNRRNDLSNHFDVKIAQLQESKKKLENNA